MSAYRSAKKIARKTLNAMDSVYLSAIRYIDGVFGERLRYRYYSRRLRHLGPGARIDTGVFIYGCRYVSIGDGTHIDKGCIIIGAPKDIDLSSRAVRYRRLAVDAIQAGEVRIGKNCHIAQNCMIFGYGGVLIGDYCAMSTGAKIYSLTSLEYNPDDPSQVVSILPFDGVSPTLVGKVAMEDNSWIGIDVVVFPGVRIGPDSFVRSRSMVMSSFGGNSYIAGDPAVRVRERFARKEGR